MSEAEILENHGKFVPSYHFFAVASFSDHFSMVACVFDTGCGSCGFPSRESLE